MSKDNGGPVFPFEYHNQTASHQPGFFDTGTLSPGASQQFAGMSLRDYFAAKALQGLISTAVAPCPLDIGGCENEAASTAYKLADAMLLARSASHGG